MNWKLTGAIALIAVFQCTHFPAFAQDKESRSNVTYRTKRNEKLETLAIQAQKEWPKFKEAFAKKDGTDWLVKVTFEDPRAREFMWIGVTKIDGDDIYGKLATVPDVLTQYKIGQDVQSNAAKIRDWMYTDKAGKQHGGYQIDALQKEKAGE